MKTFIGEGLGRVVVINLQRGEKVLESVRKQLQEIGIRDAVILSAIGSLQQAVFHRVTGMQDSPVDEFVTLTQPMELASIQGVVMNGEPHFHMVVSDLTKTYTGHLEEETTVVYLCEISLAEIKGLNVQRIKDENNIAVLQQK